jgi:flagellar protein FliO/FliZ
MKVLVVLALVLSCQAFAAQSADKEDAELVALGETPAVDVAPEDIIADELNQTQAADGAQIGAQVSEATKNLKESEIPVFAEAKKNKDVQAEHPVRKMAISLALILSVIGGVGFFLRRWLVQKKALTPNRQIRVISQHFLGPRKSLAIVYVAGESLLVGVTDQNISLIKQLSLIDDEIPSDLPKKFDETLDFAEVTQPEAGEAFTMRGLKEIVSSRLKNMREI